MGREFQLRVAASQPRGRRGQRTASRSLWGPKLPRWLIWAGKGELGLPLLSRGNQRRGDLHRGMENGEWARREPGRTLQEARPLIPALRPVSDHEAGRYTQSLAFPLMEKLRFPESWLLMGCEDTPR